MEKAKLEDIASKMRKLDICMMITNAKESGIVSRPMSNNGDVEYDGNSYFFSQEESNVVKELKAYNKVNLTFQGAHQLYISIAGKADLITDKAALEEHWLDELEKWFEDGVNTPGIIMIHVKAENIKFWHKEEQGEIKL
ncbi:MAG: pyridoxamine 5'-phosphate oxidase family protein [Bacteroidota bacterium]|nr:pyridoxamine 5'-phosphate oxidase family protein [Bacteroidota bacterium]